MRMIPTPSSTANDTSPDPHQPLPYTDYTSSISSCNMFGLRTAVPCHYTISTPHNITPSLLLFVHNKHFSS